MRNNNYKGANPVYRGQWRTIRKQILARDNNTCQIGLPGCASVADSVDHIQPVALGGAWYDPSNLRAACKHCNGELGKIAARVKREQTPTNVQTTVTRITSTPSRNW